MATCPKCQSDIEITQQFFGGLFTCPRCQAVFFTNFDGVPEASSASSTEISEPMVQEISTGDEGQTEKGAPSTFDSPMESQISQEPKEAFSVNQENLNDVIRYGNSDQVSSPMSYRLVIEGLDLLQNVNELKEVISDSKLQLNFSELKRKIHKGQLVIERLTPAKAAVLAQRMRALNLSMKWELKIYE